jgi:hypothetical protein
MAWGLPVASTDAAEAYELLDPGEAIGDLAIVAYVYPQHHDEGGRSRYITLFGQDEVPDHVARGLWFSAVSHLDDPDG